MAAAVIDLSQGTEATGHPVVNVIEADPAVDVPPDGCQLIEAPDGADQTWRWGSAAGFIRPPRPAQTDPASDTTGGVGT